MTNTVFRNATMDDARRILEWRNDDESRAGSVRTPGKLIPWEVHEEWFRKTLAMPRSERWLLIAEIGGHPVGLIRFDSEEDGSYDITWIVAPEHRRKGIATRMVLQAVDLIDTDIIAKINIGVTASHKIAAANGFTLEKTENGVCHWRRRRSVATRPTSLT